MFKRKNLLGLQNLSREEITFLLDTAVPMKDIISRPIKKVPTLRGKTVVNLFYENSTRTRSSFELAAKYLSADSINISSSSSSVAKGESLYDTARTIQSLGADAIILRHPMAGSPRLLARSVNAAVINAGDGAHEHPSQALLDLFTVRERMGRLAGLRVAIVGDVLHSRVARSDIWGFTRMGAEVSVCGPPTLIPPGLDRMGVRVFHRLEEALPDANVIIMLRIQKERQQQGLFPSLREYAILYGLNRRRLALAKSGALVLHPGPMNRGVEISADIADGTSAVIEEQVTNGVAVRMALLYLLAGGGERHENDY
ncbi:aspartate carbamoyltransferase [Desulfotomaculum arcticum]|uniref:Aspartate carbamoyltransferase n=1 Tax=Desulfotruncus arcticus DSM 17038 TaxID=1121424 RepID=A0A1I2XXU2_9FIRM|nr:aspartate carbamoyltransferase catalytic subunit [Desulfotruncus arcticus]SFH18283.1 aspartate carbamoyltransferase [Desulfotomaculum arcticum] [Desulfotruncus arcticus DSM 17038]